VKTGNAHRAAPVPNGKGDISCASFDPPRPPRSPWPALFSLSAAQGQLAADQNQLQSDQAGLASAQQAVIAAQNTLASSTKTNLTPEAVAQVNALLKIQ
jgi:hypothetical protein